MKSIPKKSLRKVELKKLIEPFIYEKLRNEEYIVYSDDSKNLLSWNRLDLAFKLFYLNNKNLNTQLAELVYKEDVKAQTLGTFTEFGNESEKNSFQVYLNKFNSIFERIRTSGFDQEKTLIPVSDENSIINGSHRVASTIFLNKKISFIKTEQISMIADYHYFYKRNVSSEVLDIVTKEFIKYSKDNIFIAFLWPSGKEKKEKAESKFSNIVYRKELKLTPRGGFNLLVELYKHMDWVGTEKNGFQGAKQKLIECFPTFDEFTVIVFQEDNIEKVRKIKEAVRQVHDLGFSSIHITDTRDEAIRISKLIFNDNGLHFLNYANPLKYLTLYKDLAKFQRFLEENSIKNDEVVIDSSVVLSLYGLRKKKDIDYLIVNSKRVKNINSDYELHDSVLKFHSEKKVDLIYNPHFYFDYRGFKFISFNQLYKMKKERNEKKDKNDCKMMNALLENNKLQKTKAKIKQYFFYFKIKAFRNIRLGLLNILKITKLYFPIRFLFRFFKSEN